MNEVTQKYERSAAQLIAAAFAVGLVAVAVPRADAGDSVTSRWGNPCDTRDACSADPAKYAAFRDSGPVKAREYVGEMQWTNSEPPKDAYIVSKTVGSRDLAVAKACEVRDACTSTSAAYKVVRVGPSGDEISTAKKADDVQVANQRIQK
jgi:hypothetical protein